MVRELTKVVYKPSVDGNEEFIVIVNPEEYKRWKEGDTTIPLVDVVDSYEIFWSNQGAQGLLGRPSKQQLENAFGTSKDDEVIKQILEKGKEESGKGIRTGDGATNVSKGSIGVDTKGKGLRGI